MTKPLVEPYRPDAADPGSRAAASPPPATRRGVPRPPGRVAAWRPLPAVAFVLGACAVVAVAGVPVASQVRRSAVSGVIRGRVELRRPLPIAERRPNVADLGSPGRRDIPDRSK